MKIVFLFLFLFLFFSTNILGQSYELKFLHEGGLYGECKVLTKQYFTAYKPYMQDSVLLEYCRLNLETDIRITETTYAYIGFTINSEGKLTQIGTSSNPIPGKKQDLELLKSLVAIIESVPHWIRPKLVKNNAQCRYFILAEFKSKINE